jgi:hypothetical protein
MADASDLTEEEIALIVAIQKGTPPRADDPLCHALAARGLVRLADDRITLTPAGEAYGRETTGGA